MGAVLNPTMAEARVLARSLDRSDPQAAANAVLMQLGVPANNVGHEYLIRVIAAVLANPFLNMTEAWQSVSKELPARVSYKAWNQAMTDVIKRGWEHRDPERWSRFLGAEWIWEEKRPSNSEFIFEVARFLRLWQGCYRKEEVQVE